MKAPASISAQIVTLIQTEDWPVGTHMRAQALADRLRVSRSPVNEALQLLEDKGVLLREQNRGYFLAKATSELPAELLQEVGVNASDAASTAYFKIAEDRLLGRLPDTFSEASLKSRYQLTPAQLSAVLTRIAQEGWAERKPGYGWAFSSMLTTPDSLLKSYRLRLALEPAALLEPGYRLDKHVLIRCRSAEMHLLQGGIEVATADELHDRGVNFHESLVEASGNAFFIDTIRRVNRVRRLLSYRSMRDRTRYVEHCHQHLAVLDLLERERNEEASIAMRDHLSSTLRNLQRISDILQAAPVIPPPLTSTK
ncbi:GntR family transcriptional regulator [Polaromonas sp. SM01]|uniref:GntR family transcriptional regulator n=1 Tax=Polaromonas sp. SM01 TaxID=3085630 RepID=UPI002981C82B|nr:GntR family transcriptional regulator [Polaromonas sp. SM01]MDW5442912.1 GntR family transcriptional regulator [Polaromonas sp. SM01]